jgi:hypothetical protein
MLQPLKFLVKCGPSSKPHQVIITETGIMRLPSHKKGHERKYDEICALAAICGNSVEELNTQIPFCLTLRREWERSFTQYELPSMKDMEAFMDMKAFMNWGVSQNPIWYVQRLLEKHLVRSFPSDWPVFLLSIWRSAKEAKGK